MGLPATFPAQSFTVKGDPDKIFDLVAAYRGVAEADATALANLQRTRPEQWKSSEYLGWLAANSQQVAALEGSRDAHQTASDALRTFGTVIGQLQAKMRALSTTAHTDYLHASFARAAHNTALDEFGDAHEPGGLKSPIDAQRRVSTTANQLSNAVAVWDADCKRRDDLIDDADDAAVSCALKILGIPRVAQQTAVTCGMESSTTGPLPMSDADIREAAMESQQGAPGDCYLLAPLRAVAMSNPQWIRHHMRYDACTGHYSVQLYDEKTGSWSWYDVDPNDLLTGGVHGNNDSTDWLGIYERAYSEMHHGTADDNHINGGNAGTAFQAITGQKSNSYGDGHDGKPSLEEMDRVLKSGGSVVVGTEAISEKQGPDGKIIRVDGPQGNPTQVPDDKRLCPGHAYQVVSVDPVNHTVTVANPWGSGGGKIGNPDSEAHPGKHIYPPDQWNEANVVAAPYVTMTEDEYNRWFCDGDTIGKP